MQVFSFLIFSIKKTKLHTKTIFTFNYQSYIFRVNHFRLSFSNLNKFLPSEIIDLESPASIIIDV